VKGATNDFYRKTAQAALGRVEEEEDGFLGAQEVGTLGWKKEKGRRLFLTQAFVLSLRSGGTSSTAGANKKCPKTKALGKGKN